MSRRVGAATFSKAQIAVQSWAGAHGKLKAALSRKRASGLFEAFFAAVRDVYSAFSDGRALAE